jgi:hypothetical protein
MHSLRGAFEHAPHSGSGTDLQGSQNAEVTARDKHVEAIKAGEHPLLRVVVVVVRLPHHSGLAVCLEPLPTVLDRACCLPARRYTHTRASFRLATSAGVWPGQPQGQRVVAVIKSP